MTTEPEPIDEDLLSRWIGIAHLLANAEEMAGRAGSWPALALVTADTASEAVLGLIAGDLITDDRAGFDDVYDAAIRALDSAKRPLSQSLRTRIQGTHRVRNIALHRGVEQPASVARRAVRTARDLRDAAIESSPLLGAFQATGPVRAVAKLVDVPDISMPLDAAEEALVAGDVEVAANQAAIAYQILLERIAPPLRVAEHRSGFSAWRSGLTGRPYPGSQQPNFEHVGQELEKEFQDINRRERRLEGWVLALGLGLSPRELGQLERILGRVRHHGMSPEPREPVHIRDEGVELTLPAVEAALLRVADIAFRLWRSDSLYTGPERWRNR